MQDKAIADALDNLNSLSASNDDIMTLNSRLPDVFVEPMVSLIGGNWATLVRLPDGRMLGSVRAMQSDGRVLCYGILDADEETELTAAVDPLPVFDYEYHATLARAINSAAIYVDFATGG